MKNLLLVSALIAGLLGSSAAGIFRAPSRPVCRAVWLFSIPCSDVRMRLMDQMQAFSIHNSCPKCRYVLEKHTDTYIHGHHTSERGVTTENLSFDLHSNEMNVTCRVIAASSSVRYTTHTDNSQNYCIIHDLLTASGLEDSPDFNEITSNWACSGYEAAPCRNGTKPLML